MEVNFFNEENLGENDVLPGYIVYMYTNIVNGKKYIGITKRGSIKYRTRGKFKGYKGCSHLYAAIHKYGWESFKKEVIAYNCTKEEAESMEKEFIAFYDSTNPQKGYNIQKGGISAGGLSEEGRKRLSEINSGGNSPVALAVISFTLDGKKLREFDCLKDAEDFYGLPPAMLTLGSRMGSSPRGGYYFRRKADVGDIAQLPKSEMKLYNDRSVFVGANAAHICPVVLFDKNTGKRIAEFGCAKDASEFAGVDVTYCMRGTSKTCGDYICYRAKDVVGVDMLQALDKHKPRSTSKAVLQYSLEGELLSVFESAREASRQTGVSFGVISNCVRHKSQSGGGYVWRLIEDPFSKPTTTWETRIAQGKVNSIAVEQIDLATGAVIATYGSYTAAAKAVGSHKQCIRDVVKGKGLSAAGYGWRVHQE